MTDADESAYEQGRRSVWVNLLAQCVRELGYQSNEAKHAAWIVERERAIATLRDICEAHGDNDWPDEMNLSDILNKHVRYDEADGIDE